MMMKRSLLFFAAAALAAVWPARAQEHSAKFAHIRFPEEIREAVPNAHNAFANDGRNIYRINTDDWTFETVYELKGGGYFTRIQAMTTHGDRVYWYVNGDGLYEMDWNGTAPRMARKRDDSFVRHIEEAYSGMKVDPTGQYLLLYGKNENVAVFDIMADMTPLAAFNDYVPDAHWYDNCLWAGCLDKVVVNRRLGRSENNNDFINMGSNDQTGMTKIYVKSGTPLPNMGEQEMYLGIWGELVRFIHNKGNGDLLMCINDYSNIASVFRVNDLKPELVARFNGYFGDFAAYGDKIVARTGGGFVETVYDPIEKTDLKPKEIETDLLQPKMWEGQTPRPYTISGNSYMDFDEKGNLWIVKDRDLFVVFNK